MPGAWRRLVWYYQEPKFSLMAAGIEPLTKVTDPSTGEPHQFGHSDDEVKLHVAGVVADVEARCSCPRCLCEPATVLLDFCKKEPVRASRMMYSAECTIPPGAAVVERQHLLGQELKPKGSRGRAPGPQVLAAETYRLGILRTARRRAAKIEQYYLKNKHGISKTRLHRFLNFHTLKPIAKTTKRMPLVRGLQETKKRSTSAYHTFRAAEWSSRARVGSAEWKEGQSRISALWKRRQELNIDAAIYEGLAATKSAKRQRLREGSWRAVQDEVSDLSRHSAWAATHDVCARIVKEMTESDTWKCNSVGSMISALRPEFVDTQKNFEQVAREHKHLFQYDPTVVANPLGTHLPSTSCHGGNYGVCRLDTMAAACKTLTKNLYQYMKSKRCGRGDTHDLPVLLAFGFPAKTEHVLLVDSFGRGDTLFFMKSIPSPEHPGKYELQWQLLAAHDVQPVLVFSQMHFRDFLHSFAGAIFPDYMTISAWSLKDGNPENTLKNGEIMFEKGEEPETRGTRELDATAKVHGRPRRPQGWPTPSPLVARSPDPSSTLTEAIRSNGFRRRRGGATRASGKRRLWKHRVRRAARTTR